MKKLDSILEKDELDENLRNYFNIFQKEIYDYLVALIDLDISAMDRSQIDNEKLDLIKGFKIYKDISRFNIYTHAIELFSKSEGLYTINNNNDIANNNLEIVCKYTDTYNNTIYRYNTTQDYIHYNEISLDEDKRKEIIKSKLEILDSENNKIREKFDNLGCSQEDFANRNKTEEEIIELIMRYNNITEFEKRKYYIQDDLNKLIKFYNIELEDTEVGTNKDADFALKQRVLVGNTEFMRYRNYY